jgi:hypothetical protein
MAAEKAGQQWLFSARRSELCHGFEAVRISVKNQNFHFTRFVFISINV